MKISKVILGSVITLLLITELNASRTKKNLIPDKENEIVSLLEKKIAILDELLVEAKIYKNEKDPLIQKDFYNLPSGFISKYRKSHLSIGTHTDTSSLVKKKKKTGFLGVSSNKIGISNSYLSNSKRKIFGIEMRKSFVFPTSFVNDINYIYTLGYSTRTLANRNADIQSKDLLKLIDKDISNTIQPMALELLEKYIEFISLLSKNETREDFSKRLQKNTLTEVLEGYTIKKWLVDSPLIVFELPINKSNPHFERKQYDLSEVLSNQLNTLHAKGKVNITDKPNYYKKGRIAKTMQCIETSKDIKYKGRICTNPINIDKDIYFDHGTFETRENNFLNVNKELLESLNGLNKKLEEASRKYVKFFILEITSPTPDKNMEIDLEGGL